MDREGRAVPRFAAAAVAALALRCFATGGVVDAQSLSIPHAVTCPACKIVRLPVVNLGGTGDDLLAPNSQLARDSRGRYFGTSFGRRSLVVWDSSGKYLRALGTDGAGPGEFAGNIEAVLVGAGDTIYVYDGSLRISVFTPQLTYTRSFRAPGRRTSMAVLPQGDILLGAQVPSIPGGNPLHVLAADGGRILRSFGADSIVVPLARGNDPRAGLFEIAQDGRSAWRWNPSDYRLARWETSGTKREIFDLTSAPWYRARQERPASAPLTREQQAAWIAARTSTSKAVQDSLALALAGSPASSINMAGVDQAGRIWIIGNEPYAGLNPDEVVWILEVIDPVRRRKLLSVRVDGLFRLVPGTDLAYSRHRDADGVLTIAVWRVRIDGL